MKKLIYKVLTFAFGIMFCFGVFGGFVQNMTVFATSSQSQKTKLPVNNLNEDDWDYIFEQGEIYMDKNPNSSDEKIEDYIRSEITKISIKNEKTPSKSGYELTDAEWWLAFWHPIMAAEVNYAKDLSLAKTNQYYNVDPVTGKHYQNNADAFRHGYWNALMVKSIGAYYAEQFATAHESEETDQLDKNMDLTNNEVGRNDGEAFSYMTNSELADQIMLNVSKGHYYKIKHSSLVPTDLGYLKDEFIIHITTVQHFNNIRNHPSGIYVMANNIDLSGFSSWDPIPYLDGVLDGNGFTITGLSIPSMENLVGNSTAYIGLFAENQGTIMNLNIANASFESNADHRNIWSHVGFVAGLNGGDGTIRNVTVTGQMGLHRDYSTMGGIAGKNTGLIADCEFGSSSSNSSLFGNGDMGGIAGENNNGGIVTDSHVFFAQIRHYLTFSDRSIGGIVGYNNSSTVMYCSVWSTTIANVGKDSNTPIPSMGLIIGHASLTNLWYVSVSNSTLVSGSLGGAQRIYFGAHYWQQVGSAINVDYRSY